MGSLYDSGSWSYVCSTRLGEVNTKKLLIILGIGLFLAFCQAQRNADRVHDESIDAGNDEGHCRSVQVGGGVEGFFMSGGTLDCVFAGNCRYQF